MASNGRSAACRTGPGILCLSHLGWDGVWQRPQQLLSRLAARFPVLYVGEPEIDPSGEGEPRLDPVADRGRLRAWRPVFPDRPEVIGPWREVYAGLVADLLVREGWAERSGDALAPARPLVAWFTTPTPWYVLAGLPADLVVYDVMDDLAAFKGASEDLAWRDDRLMARADLVFAGGRSLYEARRGRHPRVHCFPSGVDAAHFARALDPATPVPPELVGLPRPVLGYYGVIDERLDLDLLAGLADLRPGWSVVVVGPVAKIREDELPRRPNLRYLGRRPYERLPGFLRGFDACLMPFALNAATRSISPTKTLEYMAARRPVVSTAVPDVVASWPGAVRVAEGAGGFAAAAAELLAEPATARAERERRQDGFVAANGWDRIAGEMGTLVDAALGRNGDEGRRTAAHPVPGAPAADRRDDNPVGGLFEQVAPL